MSTPTIADWHGCYDSSWKGVIVDDAFSHPAKFSFGLIQRIVRHGLEQGYWAKGQTIGDPFGGVALGGIVAGCHGLNWVGVELEPRFVELGNQNLAKNGPLFMDSVATCVKLVQGDSRRFAEIVGEVAGVVTSPPYDVHQMGGGGNKHDRNIDGMKAGYGDTPGQIGRLKSGNLDGVITSPPYAEGLGHGKDGHGKQDVAEEGDRIAKAGGDPKKIAGRSGTGRNHYGTAEGQIGQDVGETYWEAMAAVYSQMLLAMKPGAVAAIVLKDYVKDKARVPLCDQTTQLLESIGFHVFERTRCHLVKTTTHPDLFGGPDHVDTKERKSFFRRLAEKSGSPRIDWEEVIWART